MVYSFERLKKSIIVTNGTNYINYNFNRDVCTKKIYEEHRKTCIKNKESVQQYILDDIVDNFTEAIVLAENTFPYDLEEGLIHKVLWSKVPLNNMEIQAFLEFCIDTKDYEYIWFENMSGNKSIPDIPHSHIILRKKILINT